MNLDIKINNKIITLGPWTGYGTINHLWNFYRVSINTFEEIGFVVDNKDLFKEDPNLCTWKLDTTWSSSLKCAAQVFINMYGENFNYSNLETAKSNLDNLLLKFDDLKIYL
jgi:hypothetical protein